MPILPVVFAKRGIGATMSLCKDYLLEGRGFNRFAAWCRETVAYEHRQHRKSYGRWLRRTKLEEAPTVTVERVVTCHYDPTDDNALVEAIHDCNLDYLLLIPDGTQLHEHGLPTMLHHAQLHNADLVYPDEDCYQAGERTLPAFKPSFSIDLARVTDYIGPCFLLRLESIQSAIPSGSSSFSPYELILRLHESGAIISRCPNVLISCSKPRSSVLDENQLKARDAHLRRAYDAPIGKALANFEDFDFQVLDNTKISIIIPTKNRIDLLQSCLKSIDHARVGLDLEIIVLDNRSDEPTAKKWLQDAESRYVGLKVIDADYEFNWSKLNNHGVQVATGDVLMFLNNDIETDSSNWIAQLALHALRSDVGAVGPLLAYPNGEIQHAGIVIGMGGFADHVYACVPPDRTATHQFVSPFLPRNVLGCTGACLVMQRHTFDRVNGFNENLKICGDVDICLRLIQLGLHIVYEPRTLLTHYESATRPKTPLPIEEINEVLPLIQTYLITGDPFYNPNLSLGLRYPTCYGA